MHSAWSAVALRVFRNMWIGGGGADGMVRPLAMLDTTMKQCAIRGSQSHNIVSLSASRCYAAMGWRASAF